MGKISLAQETTVLTLMRTVNGIQLIALTSIEIQRSGYTFGKGQRPAIDENSNLGVGPGAYNYNPKDKSKLGKFTKEKRLGLPLTSNIDIGPGQYNIQSKNKGGWTIAKKYRTQDDINIPGPGAYQQVDTTRYKKFESVGIKFGRSGRDDREPDSIPGPGAFTVPSKFRGGYSFGNSKRAGMVGDQQNPGPGAYTLGEFKVRIVVKCSSIFSPDKIRLEHLEQAQRLQMPKD